MSISEKLEKNHKNQIENIKNEKNHKSKIKQIGALVLDVGGRCINAISKALGHSRAFISKCRDIVKNNLEIVSNKDKSGRKSITIKYPNLKNDIDSIVDKYSSTDPKFKSEKRYVRLTIKEIRNELITNYGYPNNFISKTTLGELLNKMGYNLKKVQKSKPLKKIEETDKIFENVNERKQKALENDRCVLISIDTKDKVLIGPFSRNGTNRTLVEACDHELTNDCLIPFGILDIKTSKPYFYNFKNKPTSNAMVDCIEDFWKTEYQNTSYNQLSILLDNGPDNSGTRTAFLKELVNLSNKYNISIELIYYPPYHSKYNPIERLWARLENIWNGFLLETTEICLKFMDNLTWKGNKSLTKYITKKYEKGITIDKKEMRHLEKYFITRNPVISKYSLIISPYY